MDYKPPDSFVCGIFHARILTWVAISSSRGSSWPASPVFPALQVDSLPLSHQGKLSLGICSNSCQYLMLSNRLILCCLLLLLPSIFPSIRVFSNKLALHIRWPKYWSFSFSNRPSNEYSGLIQCWIFRLTIDWQYNLNILFYVMIRVSLKRHVFWNQCYNLFCFYVKKRETSNVGIVGMQKSHILRISGFTYFQRYSWIKTYCTKNKL